MPGSHERRIIIRFGLQYRTKYEHLVYNPLKHCYWSVMEENKDFIQGEC